MVFGLLPAAASAIASLGNSSSKSQGSSLTPVSTNTNTTVNVNNPISINLNNATKVETAHEQGGISASLASESSSSSQSQSKAESESKSLSDAKAAATSSSASATPILASEKGLTPSTATVRAVSEEFKQVDSILVELVNKIKDELKKAENRADQLEKNVKELKDGLCQEEKRREELEKEVAKQQLQEAPLGSIVGVAGPVNTIVAAGHWLLCDGRALPVNPPAPGSDAPNYNRLFQIISTTSGSSTPDGVPHFHLPDLRGYVLRGYDPDAKVDPDATKRTQARKGANSGNAVGTVQENANQAHNHPINIVGSGHPANATGNAMKAYAVDYTPNTHTGPGGAQFTVFQQTFNASGLAYSVWEQSFTLNPTSHDGGTDCRPNNISVNWIIRAI